MRRVLESLVAAMLVATPLQGHAMGAPAFVDDRWNPAHVQALPPFLRARLQEAAPMCGPLLEAEHYIATYIRAGKAEYAILHFESLRCTNREFICHGGRCLHEVYKTIGTQSRRVLQSYTREMRLNTVGDKAVVEMDCEAVPCGPVWLP